MHSLTFLCFSLLLYPSVTVSLGSSNATTTEELALIAFKSMLFDPSGSLASWNASNRLCRWRGVTCGRRQPERVVALNVNLFGLSGRVSPFLGNLSYLRWLNLGENQLVGRIPHELGRLGKLRVLNLNKNSLEGSIPATLGECTGLMQLNLSFNHLQGEIPREIGNLRNLVYLNLYLNDLSGEIPLSLGNLSSITSLFLHNNTLSGKIPSFFGNLSNLKALALSFNELSGGIPSSFSRLHNLSVLDLEVNNLSGSVPPAIWNISSLRILALSTNPLGGTIPPNALNGLPLLEEIYIGQNQFHGPLPSSLANASNLLRFQAPYNSFSGVVPPEVGGLQRLQWLVLFYNALEAKEPKDWKFITALTNCSQLQSLLLTVNRFSGVLPSTVSNLSTSLMLLDISNNEISGNIPKDIGNLVQLQGLALGSNYLTGTLPSSMSALGNMQVLGLENNSLSGPIPWSIGNLTGLIELGIGVNNFTGSIPSTLGKMMSLLSLDLSRNKFTGTIPSSLFNITTLSKFLDISHNRLEGPIPSEIGNLENIGEIDAHLNRLSGEIPKTLSKCQVLYILYLSNNSLTGNIFPLSGLKGLEILDLSGNNLSGQIPKVLGDFSSLYGLDLSFNDFDGEVPTEGVFANATGISVQGNSKLCGGIQNLHLPPCSPQTSKKRHKFPVLPVVMFPVAATICILVLLYFFLACHKKRSTESPTMFIQGHPPVSYQQLVKATDGFSAKSLLGTGSYGSVYKGKLYDDTDENPNLVAIKVLKLQTPGALKSFTAECEAMRNLRHRNLVKVITACSSIDFSGNDFKAIVFDFMPNGSLEDWLHPDTNDQTELKHLNLLQRVGVLLDVAYALDYLHCCGATPIVHCDIKPTNVLLDAEMVAHVGDFGLVKILAEGSSSFKQSTSSIGFRGTIGYAAPEYGAGNMASTQGDIYSYGILVLEVVTGKRPTDNISKQGLNLHKYVEIALPDGVLDIIDKRLAAVIKNDTPLDVDDPSKRKKIGCLTSLLRLGISCSEEIPISRMPTKDIIRDLHEIREALM